MRRRRRNVDSPLKVSKRKEEGVAARADLTLIILVSTRLQVSTAPPSPKQPPQPLTCAHAYNVIKVVETFVAGVMAMCGFVGVGDKSA